MICFGLIDGIGVLFKSSRGCDEGQQSAYGGVPEMEIGMQNRLASHKVRYVHENSWGR